METDVYEAVRPLAGLALRYAIREDWPRAGRAVQAIGDQFEGEGVLYAILGWCDTCIDRVNVDTSKPIRLVWLEQETGKVTTDAEEVRAEARWAGQVMAARAACDQETFNALLLVLPDDPRRVGTYVFTLLTMAALNIKHARQAAAKDGDRG